MVAEICARSGLTAVDVSQLYGLLRGYSVAHVASARAALQPLMLAFGFEVIEREGKLTFRNRTGHAYASVDPDVLAWLAEQETPVELTRAADAETVGRLRLNFVDADGDYDIRTEESVFPDDTSLAVSQSDIPVLLTLNEARAITERWLAEARVARDTVRFSLPLSEIETGAGDVIAWDVDGEDTLYRIDRVTQSNAQVIEAVRVEPEVYHHSDAVDLVGRLRPFSAPAPVDAVFMDLPLLTGEEVAHAPHLAVKDEEWPGSVAVYSSPNDSGYVLNTLVQEPSVIGVTQTLLHSATAGVLDRGGALRVSLSAGELASAELDEVLNGANVAAIGDGSSDNWEVFQFTDATLVSEGVYDIIRRLRGQAGTDALASTEWPAGSTFVLLDGSPAQLSLSNSARGLARHYLVGPSQRPYDDPSFEHYVEAFDGIGLRPLAPVHLRAKQAGSGDYDISWVRRTRIDGDNWQSVEVPLGEDSEGYLVRVLDGGNVVREVTVGSPGWTYTAGQQSSDGIFGGFSIQVAQISARFGARLFRRIDLNG